MDEPTSSNSATEHPSPGEVTLLLEAAQAGDRQAFDRLFSMVYRKIKRLARQRLGANRQGATLNTTGLVHEAYLKLVGAADSTWHGSSHFYAVAARAMRQVVIDHARRHSSAKRGAGRADLRLEENPIPIDGQAEQLFDLDCQLTALAEHDPRLVRVIECRFFAGLSERETAEALDVSISTVHRDWARARAWFALNSSQASA